MGIQRSGRLIGKKKRGVICHSSGTGTSLLLTAGYLIRKLILYILNLQKFHHILTDFLNLFSPFSLYRQSKDNIFLQCQCVQYIVQTKKRLQKDVASIGKDLHLTAADEKTELTFAGVQAEPFAQDGHNGGDYIVVVGDKVLQRMKPYYSELAVDLKGETPQGLEQKLDALADPDDRDFSGHTVSSLSGNSCSGSDTVLVYTATNLVRDNLIPELKMLLASMIVPLFYMGLVFVCVALTVLSVQQLSDSSKYKFRYDVLEKIGLSPKQVRSLLLRQMAGYYLCPALLALVISGKMVLYISGIFVRGTGVSSRVSTYFVEGTLLFMGIYLVYFAVTFLCFQRSIFLKER